MSTEPPPTPQQPTALAAFPKIAKNGLHVLHEIFRRECDSFRSPRLSDVVIIAIGFENINTIKSVFSQKNNCQVGLAVLDTKEINQVSPDKLISTLLLLAAKGFTDKQRDQAGDHDTLDILQQVSNCPIPHWVDPEVPALEKREKRRERSRKYQSKTWSKEKQERIRAARKLRKEGITNSHGNNQAFDSLD